MAGWIDRARPVGRWFVAVSFVAVGVAHFVVPEPFVLIVPAYLPWHLELVYLSGAFEIAGGVGVLTPRLRRLAGWGLIALLAAVYPANINMLVNDIYLPDMPQERWLLWARMPMQFVMAAMVLWAADIWPAPARPTETRPPP